MKKKTEATSTKKSPIHRLRVGAVSGSIFLNQTKDEVEFPSAVITRSYKEGNGYKNSNSYGAKHLAELVALATSLQSWINANYPEAANK